VQDAGQRHAATDRDHETANILWNVRHLTSRLPYRFGTLHAERYFTPTPQESIRAGPRPQDATASCGPLYDFRSKLLCG
jgi:hypothetical protein